LAKALLGDPKLDYRKAVKQYIRGSQISVVGYRILRRRRIELNLTAEVAIAIEQEVLKPFQEYQANLQEYEQGLAEAIAHENPLSSETLNELKILQQMLKLRDEDVEPIVSKMLGSPPNLGDLGGDPISASELQTFSFEIVTVSATGKIINRDRRQASYFSAMLAEGITLEMVQIPGGTFEMGAAPGEEGASDDEYPQHRVTIAPFFMSKYVVTQAQWRTVATLID
jgi:formylglycine-generating enzyme required for sulfatase activity